MRPATLLLLAVLLGPLLHAGPAAAESSLAFEAGLLAWRDDRTASAGLRFAAGGRSVQGFLAVSALPQFFEYSSSSGLLTDAGVVFPVPLGDRARLEPQLGATVILVSGGEAVGAGVGPQVGLGAAAQIDPRLFAVVRYTHRRFAVPRDEDDLWSLTAGLGFRFGVPGPRGMATPSAADGSRKSPGSPEPYS